MKKKGIKDMSNEVKKVLTQNRWQGHCPILPDTRQGRLLRFLFQPPRLGPVPPAWVSQELAGVAVFNRFAARLARHPVDLVTHLGMARANAYHAAGCPLELCDHAAARDVWRVIHQDAIPANAKEAPCH